jgi:hypothetical protein
MVSGVSWIPEPKVWFLPWFKGQKIVYFWILEPYFMTLTPDEYHILSLSVIGQRVSWLQGHKIIFLFVSDPKYFYFLHFKRKKTYSSLV